MATAEEGCSISATILALSPTLQANPVTSHAQPLWPASAARHVLLLGRKPAGNAGRAEHSLHGQVFTHRLQFNAWEYSSTDFSPSILLLQITHFQVQYLQPPSTVLPGSSVLLSHNRSTPSPETARRSPAAHPGLPRRCCQRAILISLP